MSLTKLKKKKKKEVSISYQKVQSMWGKEPGKLVSLASLCCFLSHTSLLSCLPLISSLKHLLFSTLEEVSGAGQWQFLFPLSYKVNLHRLLS